MAEIIKLYGEEGSSEGVVLCQKCDNQKFYILFDGDELTWEGVYATECTKCENKLWVKINPTI